MQSPDDFNSLCNTIWVWCCSKVCSNTYVPSDFIFVYYVPMSMQLHLHKYLLTSNNLSFSLCINLYSTRVSNELGAGNPQGARIATFAAMFLAVSETTIITTTLFACRNVFGYTFSNEKEVIDYVTTMAPLVCLSVILDSFQGVLSG